ncbi:hypothetical protein PXH59_00390 (plasmid) [Xenorhabdus sp. SF857]|uniref:hypothetical protein n=1 Tax=Xenorhabdus bakwenae TaxID=3026967 RepID=UPI002558392E|nr:hypothetical protein [Xenorhabdus sp. SF857]WFQ78140.1 hypothetical protein PXH59_00390 [Xenorhabdus sp. SF857]
MESIVFVKNGIHYSLNDGSKTLEEYHEKFGNVSIVDINTIMEIKWADLKKKRDWLITDTDWTQVPDSPLSTEKKGGICAVSSVVTRYSSSV